MTNGRKKKEEAFALVEEELTSSRLHVSCAGVSMKLVKATAEKWNEIHPELLASVTPGGSVDLIRDCIRGKACDLLISADDVIIRSMMMLAFIILTGASPLWHLKTVSRSLF